uniref:Uncharacterized protein n=1 Tax=Romanomermis culicivorax TaxID=13658 RepID=A0A915KXY4_ROMCU
MCKTKGTLSILTLWNNERLIGSLDQHFTGQSEFQRAKTRMFVKKCGNKKEFFQQIHSITRFKITVEEHITDQAF